MRTPLNQRVLPVYTRLEEIINMTTHIIGALLGITALELCIVFSCLHQNGIGLFSSIVYGLSMVTLFTMSAIYHGLSPRFMAKKVFQILDHCTIYFLIAGTYTPVLLGPIRSVDPISSWILFGIVWILSIIGIILNAIDLKQYSKISMVLYLTIGWLIVCKINVLVSSMPLTGLVLLVSGGIAYTIGVIFYALQHKKAYMHCIWHVWIVIGALLHFLCVLLYCI